MAKKTVIPEVLPMSPISLGCPFCKAKRGKDCETSSGGFAVLHLARIKAAARQDAQKKSKREAVKQAAERIVRQRTRI